MITLGGIALPDDLVWSDELIWSPVSESTTITLGGALIVQAGSQVSGRPITLSGTDKFAWIDRATLLAVKALADDPSWSGALHLNGVDYTVRFRHSEGPVMAVPVVDYSGPLEDTDEYQNLVIRLREV